MNNDQPDGNRRNFTRIPFNGAAAIKGRKGQWTATILNLSLKGILIVRPETWSGKTGDEYQVDILLSDGDVKIHMDVLTAHLDPKYVGLCCTHIDLDSITHLRRLLEFNTGNEDQVIHEISNLLFSLCEAQMTEPVETRKS